MVAIRTPLLVLAYLGAALGVAPLYPWLQFPAQLLLPAGALLGLAGERRGRPLLPARAATLLTAALFLFSLAQLSLDDFVNPVVNFLAMLLAVRLASEKSPRDFLQIYLLALFVLAASTLLTLEISFFFYLVAVIVVVAVSLVLLAGYTADPDLALTRPDFRSLVRVALALPLAALVLMLGFFVVLPRTEHPLWHFLNPGDQAQTGFSETVEPGSVAATAADRALAFRAEGPELAPEDRYWRGIVLARVEQNRWSRLTEIPGEQVRITGGSPVAFQLYPEAGRGRYLITLDLPVRVELRGAHADHDLVYTARLLSGKRYQYQVSARTGARLESGGPADPALYLALGDVPSARVRELAASLSREGADAATRIARLEEDFARRGLTYATDNLPLTRDPVDDFLFGRRAGYCEHFASAFATLLRLAGVPARLVGGYYGGEYNELGGYYLVTEDLAHVWVEAFVAGEGWRRIDPSQYALNAGTTLRARRAAGLSWWRRFGDALDYFWARQVLNFDFSQQAGAARELRQSLRDRSLSGESMRRLGLGLAGVLILVVVVWAGLLELRRRRRGPVARLREAVAAAYGAGWQDPARGLGDLAQGTGDPAVAEFARIYQEKVFRDRPLTVAEQRRLLELVRQVGRRGAERPSR